ncbi:hypothetical protein C8R43DRAFT_1042544 [Mycena crocata]|nr:hypothetical protein C8R43DRAFT_1042544 [Mycena crocata]
MLHDLCVELLQEIGSNVDPTDHKSLRAVCKDVSAALGPLFFSHFVLTTNRLHLAETVTTLESLAQGEIGWSYYAKTLIIRPGREPRLDERRTDLCNDALSRVLCAALGSMQNIRTVGWQVDDTHPLWALNVVCSVLPTLPRLGDLQLSWWSTGSTGGALDLPLAQLSGLRKLTIGSRYRNPTLRADQVCSLIKQNPTLTSLHLLGGAAAGWGTVWTMLLEQTDSHIYLTDVCTDVITPDLLLYLSSYSGLQSLQYRRSYGGTRQQANALADMLYGTVLPCHANSLVCLRDLDSLTSNGARWSFGRHNADAIARLPRLETLELCVNAADVLGVGPQDNAVDLLLATASCLPALRLLSIWYHWSGVEGLGPASRYLPSVMNPAMRVPVQRFCTRIPSAAVVRAGRACYALAPIHGGDLDDADVLAYHHIDERLVYRQIEERLVGRMEYIV